MALAEAVKTSKDSYTVENAMDALDKLGFFD